MTARKPSTIAGLRRGIGTAHAEPPAQIHEQLTDLPKPADRIKPVRITLNLPPGLFRQLDHWTRDAADTLGLPRVGVQDALRAMVTVTTGSQSPNLTAQVLAELRKVLAD